jgi:hypothetical protein
LEDDMRRERGEEVGTWAREEETANPRPEKRFNGECEADCDVREAGGEDG